MTVFNLMALALHHELQINGVFGVSHADCEKIISAVLERTARALETVKATDAKRST